MNKREAEAFEKRGNALFDAIAKASERLMDERTPLVTKVAVVGLAFSREEGTVVQLVITEGVFPSWRIGRNPGDEFFELKLIPRLNALVLPQERLTAAAEVFLVADVEDLLQIYKPAEIQKIIKLVNKIETFPPREDL